MDYEAELAVVISQRALRVPTARALDYVFGYSWLNDVSARDLQAADGQWIRAKSIDTFTPLGPVIVTTDEIADPQSLRMTCRVNGVVVQDASTAQMHFSVAEIIAYCSESFTLEPRDIVATDTPGGVGAFGSPPQYLRDGDEVVIGIEGIGQLRNRCRTTQ